MQPNHATGSRQLAFALPIFVSFLLVVSAPAPAQQTTTSPAKPDIDNGLPPPGSPQTVTNKDGSTTTTTSSPMGGTQVVTKDDRGNVVSSVYRASIISGGQSLTIDAGNVSVSQQTDSHGTIRHLVKKDSITKTTTTLDYDADGSLVKATVRGIGDDGKEKPQQIYEAKGPSGSPERYNEAKNTFERIEPKDWEQAVKPFRATADEVKSIRDKFAPEPEKDDLAEARAEAARHPMTMPNQSSGPLAPPSDPFDKMYQEQQEALKQLDPCLIGTWRSISNEVIVLKEKGGGEGIVITIADDHSITIDYTGMTPMTGGNAKNVWKGMASGHMWALKGRAGTTSVEKAEAYLMTNGNRNPQGNYKDLGPAKITSYKCDETTLTVESVTHRIVYQRQQEAK